MTSNAECLTQPLAQSNIISIAVNPLLIPEVTISTISNSVLACQDVTITAIPTNGGITPSYLWFLNGGQVSNGSTYTNTSLVNGDQISCIMTSNANCKSASTAQSNIITMLVSPLPQPFIKVSGDTISSSNYFDPKYSYNWYYNGSVVSTSPFIFWNPKGSGSYYLLVNVNGCTVTSTTMDIVCTVPTIDISGNKYFTIFPNPTNNLVNISGKVKPNQEYKVTIYNVLGQNLEYKSLPVEGDDMSASLSLEYYVNGIYFIEIYGNNYREQFKVYKID